MNIKKLLISGFITHVILQIINMVNALLLGRIEYSQEKDFFLAALFLSIGVGILGILLAYVFYKIRHLIPFSNIYLKSLAFFVLLNTAFVLVLNGFEALTADDFFISTIFYILASLFFIWFYKKISKTNETI